MEHLLSLGVSAWFFKFLKDRDLSKYPSPNHFQANRPITDYYNESQRASIPLQRLYLSAFVNGNCPDKVTAKDTFQYFVEWAKTQNFQHTTNNIVFGREMGRIEREKGGVTIKKVANGNFYEIDKVKLKAYLMNKKHYDEDAVLSGYIWQQPT